MLFEHYRDFKPGEKVIEMHYHWYDPAQDPLSMDSLHNNKPLYICDNYHEWSSRHIEGMQLFEITYMFQHPLVLLEQWDWYENFTSGERFKNLLKQKKFDAVFYTPHKEGGGMRQGRIMHPRDQVISIREIKDYHLERVDFSKEQKEAWTTIMEPLKDFIEEIGLRPPMREYHLGDGVTLTTNKRTLHDALVSLEEMADLFVGKEEQDAVKKLGKNIRVTDF